MDKLNSFINNVGVLCETWSVVYSNFISQGLEAKDALMHTQGFMSAFIASAVLINNGGK